MEETKPDRPESMGTVSLFVTCLIDMFRPEAAEAAVRVLERRGCVVVFPSEQTCCGQFSYNAGYRDEAGLLAQHWIETFESHEEPIVALSGSCAAMVVHSYPALVYDRVKHHGGSEAEAEAWKARAVTVGSRVYELSQWMARRGLSDPEGHEEPTPMVYHLGCHMRRLLSATDEAHTVMASLGVRLDEPEDADQCCGFGGTYSMTEPHVSTALADAKWDQVHQKARETGSSALTGTDMGCLLHLQGRASRRHEDFPVLYLAEVMDLADTRSWTEDALPRHGRWPDAR